MQQVQISYRRPTALSDEELRSWLAGQARSLMSVTIEPAAAHSDRGLVRIKLEKLPYPGGTKDVIAGLMGDMRMLGLQPAIVA